MNGLFESVINRATETLTLEGVLICSVASILLGLLISVVYMKCSDYSKNFVISLAVLPILVQMVIMMVNGNLGTSVAIVGAFSLVRFRSQPGSSKEIAAVFFAMGVGLATAMGCIGYAVLFTVLVCAVIFVLSKTSFGENKTEMREWKITIPENLDYSGLFDDIFEEYANEVILDQVKTTNMGSLFELTYRVRMKDMKREKEMMDAIRCRNGNLTVVSRREKRGREEL